MSANMQFLIFFVCLLIATALFCAWLANRNAKFFELENTVITIARGHDGFQYTYRVVLMEGDNEVAELYESYHKAIAQGTAQRLSREMKVEYVE